VNERESSGQRLEVANVGLFDFRVVEIVEIVEGPDGLAVAQQTFAHVKPNKTRAPVTRKFMAEIWDFRVQVPSFKKPRIAGKQGSTVQNLTTL